VVVHPPDTTPPRPNPSFEEIHGRVGVAFRRNSTLGIRNGIDFAAANPTAHTLACLRFAGLVAETKLGGGLRELTRAFEARFERARADGEIAPAADPSLLASLASSVLFSIALRARAGDPKASLRTFARGAVAFLCRSVAPRSRR
jgi:AcrR family transcriptional regulator